MRAWITLNLGLICITAMLIGTEKYFIGPYALQKQQDEFMLNLIFFSKGTIHPEPPQLKIFYAGPPEPRPSSPDQDDPNEPPE